jgi:hypothetical protein
MMLRRSWVRGRSVMPVSGANQPMNGEELRLAALWFTVIDGN